MDNLQKNVFDVFEWNLIDILFPLQYYNPVLNTY